jgi:hypothetical protein
MVFVDTDHTDHNLQSFDVAETLQQTPVDIPRITTHFFSFFSLKFDKGRFLR